MKSNKGILAVVVTVMIFWGMAVTQMVAQSTNELFSLHFAGLKELKRGNENGTLLKKMLKNPQTGEIQKIFAQQLAKSGFLSFVGDKPLVTLLDGEIYVASMGGDSPSFVFAAKLGQNEAQTRFNMLRAQDKTKGVLTSEKGTVNKEETWVVQEKGQSKAVAYGCGWFMYYTWTGEKVPSTIPVALIHGQPFSPSLGTNCMEMRVHADAWRTRTSVPLLENVSSIHFVSWLQGENVRTRCEVKLSQPVNLLQSNWVLPKQVIKDPIIQLAALRGTSNFISSLPWWKQYAKGVQAPDLVFLYANTDMPFQTTVLVNSTNMVQAVSVLGQEITRWMGEEYPKISQPKLAYNTNAVELGWFGWPIITPYIRAIKDAEQDFLMVGIVSSPIKGDPIPSALWDQITKEKDLFYYSWEITGQRFQQDQMLNSLIKMLFQDKVTREQVREKRKQEKALPAVEQKKMADKHAAEQAQRKKIADWLTLISQDSLGNSVTRGNQVSADELLFERSSSCGLAAQELWILSEWLLNQE